MHICIYIYIHIHMYIYIYIYIYDIARPGLLNVSETLLRRPPHPSGLAGALS